MNNGTCEVVLNTFRFYIIHLLYCKVLYANRLHATHEAPKIHLPPDTKTVRDMCILPLDSAIFTSLRGVSIFRFVSNFFLK